MKNFKFSLAWQILIALILGIVVGAVLHNQPEIKDSIVNNVLTPLGKIFISLIKMIVIPIVFSTLILGIAGVGSTKSLGRLGFKTILYFEIITTIAIWLACLQRISSIQVQALICLNWYKLIFLNISIQLKKYSHSLMVLSRRYYRLSQRTLLVQWRMAKCCQ